MIEETKLVGMYTKRLIEVIGLFCTICAAINANALTYTEEQKLLASDGASDDGFGNSVFVDGDTAVIGADRGDGNETDSGAAYVFIRDGEGIWAEQTKLLASDSALGDEFGRSVTLDGDTVVIGAPYDNDNGDNSGSAYVFIRTGDTWAEQAKLTASDGGSNELFGRSVAVYGDTALIGAPGGEAAYVFVRTEDAWIEQAKLTASDNPISAAFGFSVAFDGDTALIGAYRDTYSAGSAYIFIRAGDTWAEQVKLWASDPSINDRFGHSVSVDGDTAVIGAVLGDGNETDSGAAYVFTRDGDGIWAEQTKLWASDGDLWDSFGFSVAVNGDTALIGAYGASTNGILAGATYVYVPDNAGTWVEKAKLTASDGTSPDYFGRSVTFDGNTVVIGADGDDDNGFYSGSAYVFSLGLELSVTIDIKPDYEINYINPRSKGLLSVAILTTESFDALQVDPDSVLFGPDDATRMHGRDHAKDVDNDGDIDLLLHFRIPETGIQCGDTEATLTGETFDGQIITGIDSIKTIGCKLKKCNTQKKHYKNSDDDCDDDEKYDGRHKEKENHERHYSKHHDDDYN